MSTGALGAKLTAMSHSGEASSDGPPDVLAVGRTDVTTLFVALAGREAEGRDEEHIAWHALDHRPEQHRLAALRHADRLVSTPARRAARAAGGERYDQVDHVMAYLFAGADWLAPLGALGVAPLLAAPFPTITPYEWGPWLP
jgi:hypothetical protein